MTTADTLKNRPKKRQYSVRTHGINCEGDPYPGKFWNLEAESPIEACAIMAKKLKIPVEWLEAKTTSSNVALTKKNIKKQNRNKISALRCEKCQSQKNKTIDNRPVFGGSKTRRRRECLICKHRFTTYEFVQTANMTALNDVKTITQLETKIADVQEVLFIAMEALKEAIKIGTPEVRNRQNLIAWSHIEVTATALMSELKKS